MICSFQSTQKPGLAWGGKSISLYWVEGLKGLKKRIHIYSCRYPRGLVVAASLKDPGTIHRLRVQRIIRSTLIYKKKKKRTDFKTKEKKRNTNLTDATDKNCVISIPFFTFFYQYSLFTFF